MRARNFASRKLLAASRPVEAQLSIQTRAISSYSSVRAGRIVGGGIQAVPDRRGRVRRKEEAPATISRGLLQLNQMRKFTPPLASPAASFCCGAVSVALGRGKNLSAAIRVSRNGGCAMQWYPARVTQLDASRYV